MDNLYYRFIIKPLPIITLAFSELVAAGFNGCYNSTVCPAIRTAQFASIICNSSAGGHQGYIHNNTANNSVAATRLKNSPFCKQFSQQPQHHSQTNIRQTSRQHPKEASRIPDRYVSSKHYDTVPGNLALQNPQPPGESGKRRRSAKLQVREQKWDKSKQWKIWEDSGKQVSLGTALSESQKNLEKPRLTAATPIEASSEEQAHPVARQTKAKHPVSKQSAATIPVVTSCPECDSVEEGSCKIKDKKNVPFKVMRNHGVIAIPQFRVGDARTPQGESQQIMIKKFHDFDGTVQRDYSFSGDGVDRLSIPLPTDRVTGFTLVKDKLVVQSRPEKFQGLSRITTMNLNDTDSAGSVDGGAASDLFVKGELCRYHDDVLYTFSERENRVYIYPQSGPDSTVSAASARVVDLKAARLAGEELVSVLVDGHQTYVAVRKAGVNTEESMINMYQLNPAGEITSEEEGPQVAGVSAQQYELFFQDEKPVLKSKLLNNAGIENLACASELGETLDKKTSEKLMEFPQFYCKEGSLLASGTNKLVYKIAYASGKRLFTLSKAYGEVLRGEELTNDYGVTGLRVNDRRGFRPNSVDTAGYQDVLESHMNRANTKIELCKLNSFTALVQVTPGESRESRESKVINYFSVNSISDMYSPSRENGYMPCLTSDVSRYAQVSVQPKLLRVEELKNIYLELFKLFIGSKVLVAHGYVDKDSPKQIELHCDPEPSDSNYGKLPVTIALYQEDIPSSWNELTEKDATTTTQSLRKHNFSMKHINLYRGHMPLDDILSTDAECRRYVLHNYPLLKYTSFTAPDIEDEYLKEEVLNAKLPTSYFNNDDDLGRNWY